MSGERVFVLEFPLFFYYFFWSLDPELLCTLPEAPHDLMLEFVAEIRRGELAELRCLLILCICFYISALRFMAVANVRFISSELYLRTFIFCIVCQ